MAFKKRVNRGFHVSVIPKAPRSHGRRSAFKRKSDHNQSCAMELLAAVAGKVLLENESSYGSSNERETSGESDYDKCSMKQDAQCDDGLFKAAALGSPKETVRVPQIEKDTLKHDPVQSLQPGSAILSQEPSVVSNSDSSENAVTNLKLGILEGIDPVSNLVSKGDEQSRSCWDSNEATNRSSFVKHIGFEEDKNKTVDVVHNITGTSKNPVGSCVKSASLGNSNRSPSSKGLIPLTSSLNHRIVSLGNRDDDENIFSCSLHSTKVKAYRPVPSRRGKKFLTCKYKVSPVWKDYKCPNAERRRWPVCQNRKTYSGRGRCESKIPSKKRKLFDQASMLTSDRGVSGESFRNMPEKCMKRSMSCSARLGCDDGASSSPKGYKSSFSSQDSHVRLSIKSLRVPEIYIEVPENTTVGSLKRKVMEAVTALIGGGVHVGIRLRGKKIRDDSKSILQTGISTKDNVGTLGFELVPDSAEAPMVEAPLSMCFDGAPFVSSDDSNCQTTRSPISPMTPSASFVARNLIPNPTSQASINDLSKSNHGVVPASAPTTSTNSMSDSQINSRAIVPYTEMNVKALNAMPLDQKAKRTEAAHRRTRRPFSVAEVEALVESVEKHGTGRWRDVKVCAFETADHRTYVDLKDKWKTLVHTAQIAPQQRRGQPVPHELLDRVLAAHAYWSQHQAKQIGKHHDAAPAIATEVVS